MGLRRREALTKSSVMLYHYNFHDFNPRAKDEVLIAVEDIHGDVSMLLGKEAAIELAEKLMSFASEL